ncbi:hypothetical protein BH20ACT2_BH20ACT2_09940 [soil metagenome]
MSPEGTIAAEQLWKRFRADQHGPKLHHHLRTVRNRAKGKRSAWRWALRDIDFHAAPGDAVALLGANGSGKSTLLKILTRVMYQDAGRVEVVGRVGALIEVIAGLHPQLSGRENAFLYGSLLGLPRRDVVRRLDEIIEFAEIEDAVDRQMKFYSSGMKMRLGFAVAAFLEPAVLLVEEVLAVGDTSFQQKCLERMQAVQSQGTTLVFVSHDLSAVEACCTRGLWLSEGVVRADGPVADTLAAYRSSIEEAAEALPTVAGQVNLRKAVVCGPDGGPPTTQQPLEITVILDSVEARPGSLCLGVSEGPAAPIFSLSREMTLNRGETEARCSIARLPLPQGRYYLWAAFQGRLDPMPWHPAARFEVLGPRLDPPPQAVMRLAPVHVDARWQIERR